MIYKHFHRAILKYAFSIYMAVPEFAYWCATGQTCICMFRANCHKCNALPHLCFDTIVTNHYMFIIYMYTIRTDNGIVNLICVCSEMLLKIRIETEVFFFLATQFSLFQCQPIAYRYLLDIFKYRCHSVLKWPEKSASGKQEYCSSNELSFIISFSRIITWYECHLVPQ